MSKADERRVYQDRVEAMLNAPPPPSPLSPRLGELCGATGRPHDFNMGWYGRPDRCWTCCLTRVEVQAAAERGQ